MGNFQATQYAFDWGKSGLPSNINLFYYDGSLNSPPNAEINSEHFSVQTYNGHDKALVLKDDVPADRWIAEIDPTKITLGSGSGQIAFWVRTSNVGNDFASQVVLWNEAKSLQAWKIEVAGSGDLRIQNDSDAFQALVSPMVVDTWYHIRGVMDYVNKQADWYVNDSLVLSNVSFRSKTEGISDIRYLWFQTRSGATAGTYYFAFDGLILPLSGASTFKESYNPLNVKPYGAADYARSIGGVDCGHLQSFLGKSVRAQG